MPLFRTPPRIRRTPMTRRVYLRRSLGSALRAARVLRSIGAPPMKHIISRPGKIMRLYDDGGLLYMNGTPINTTVVQDGFMAAGRAPDRIVQTIKFGISQLFQFSFLQNPSDLANLYDNYRIKAVKLRFDLSFNAAPGFSAAQGGQTLPHIASMPMLHYAIDPDDVTAPTVESDVLQYSKSRSVRLGDKPLFITLQPRAQGTAASNITTIGPGVPVAGLPTAAAIANMLPSTTWFDCQNGQTIPHFGLKMFFENVPIGTIAPTGQVNWTINISPTYILEMKNIH